MSTPAAGFDVPRRDADSWRRNRRGEAVDHLSPTNSNPAKVEPRKVQHVYLVLTLSTTVGGAAMLSGSVTHLHDHWPTPRHDGCRWMMPLVG
jgi:hypothetical protein